MNDKLKQWLEDNGSPEYCDYCIHDDECPRRMVCYGGEPIEPYCAGREWEEFLDLEAIEADIENGNI